MAEATYVHERQSEYWTSREIENFFADSGYEILVLPINQIVEKKVPADFLYFDKNTCKIFGLQYKALYHNDIDHWNITQTQHETLSYFPWIYYGLSEIRSSREHRVALHYVRVIGSDFS